MQRVGRWARHFLARASRICGRTRRTAWSSLRSVDQSCSAHAETDAADLQCLICSTRNFALRV